MTPKQWGDYWTNHTECSRRVWKFYQYLYTSKKLDRFPIIRGAIRLLGLIRLSSAGVERHFSLLKRIMDVCGEKIEHTTLLETRLMVLVRTQCGVSWDGNNLPSYDFNQ